MFGIVLSALNAVLGCIFRGVVIKFVGLTFLYYVVTWIANSVLTKLDISPLTNMESNINSLSSGILFFLGYFRFDVGIPMLLSAMLVGFLIRRLPIIG